MARYLACGIMRVIDVEWAYKTVYAVPDSVNAQLIAPEGFGDEAARFDLPCRPTSIKKSADR